MQAGCTERHDPHPKHSNVLSIGLCACVGARMHVGAQLVSVGEVERTRQHGRGWVLGLGKAVREQSAAQQAASS